MATTYHAVALRSANEGDEYGVVAVVDASTETNPNFIADRTTSYSRAEFIAAALNGGS